MTDSYPRFSAASESDTARLANVFDICARGFRPEVFGPDDRKAGPAMTRQQHELIARLLRAAAQPEKVSKDALAVATYIEELTTPRMIDLLLDRNDREIVIAALKTYAAQPPAAPVETEEDWREDPSSDERWNAGLDYGMVRFCACLGVDPKDVRWDAATEELDGDVCAVIGNILRVKFGENFDPDSVCRSSADSERGNYEDRHPNDMVLHPLSEIREWDEALAVLGIQDSDQTPADAIRELNAEIERLRALPQAAPDRQEVIDLIGYHFAALVSGNNQPHMSGDPRARLLPHVRRRFDDACETAADAILALPRPKLCSHEAIIGLDGKWHCQRCGDAIEMATASQHPSHQQGTENG